MFFVHWTDDEGTARRGALLQWLDRFTVAIVELDGKSIWVDKGRLILDGYEVG